MPDLLETVCLLARPPGLKVLEWLLANPASFSVSGLWTHRLEPASEDPSRPVRPEFEAFEALASRHGFPLTVVDRRRDSDLRTLAEHEPYDLLVSLSWRFLVPVERLGRSRLADLNLHRGELPGYKGASPVLRMLEDNLDHATITAHLMTAQYDEGAVIHALTLPARIEPGETTEQAAERVKRELVPHYPACLCAAVDRVLERREQSRLELQTPPPEAMESNRVGGVR